MSQVSSFTAFYDTWIEQLRLLLSRLSSSPKHPTTKEQQRNLRHIVHKVVSHYAKYYHFKSLSAERIPLSMLTSPWATSLERSLYWIADWRPTTAFHLLYTESSVLFESKIMEILRGLHFGDLSDLSSAQLHRISEIQCNVVREEDSITEELSEWQNGASELLKMSRESSVNGKIGQLVDILKKADDLRLKTLKQVVDLLRPQQAVDVLIAATELQIGIRGLGTNYY